MEPLVTVLLTSYNQPVWLRQAIQSVLDQTWRNLQLIVLDDNSSDPQVHEIIDSFTDSRMVKYRSDVSEEDRFKTTRYATLINYGVETHAAGDYLTYLTDDDWYMPERIEAFVRHAQANRHDVVYGSQELWEINALGQVIYKGIRPLQGVLHDAFCRLDHNQILHSRRVYDAVGGWPDDPKMWGGADAYFWRRITNHGYRFYPVPGGPYEAKRFHTKSVQWLIANRRWPPT